MNGIDGVRHLCERHEQAGRCGMAVPTAIVREMLDAIDRLDGLLDRARRIARDTHVPWHDHDRETVRNNLQIIERLGIEDV